jgi:hypothetical protein
MEDTPPFLAFMLVNHPEAFSRLEHHLNRTVFA